MKVLRILGTVLSAALVAACGDSNNGGTPPYTGFVRPPGTIAVSFTVDDTANKVYASGDLKWKGAMIYDSTTRTIVPDSSWSGIAPGGGPLSGWAPLMDDGPWTSAVTSHEPAGSTAGDHKFGVTVFVTPPATGSQDYDYGLIDATYETAYGNGWIWPPGPNGKVTVTAGQTTDITAPGLVIPAFGTTDLMLTLDTNNLDAGHTWDTSLVQVKGSAWAWGLITLTDDGLNGDATASDGIYTLVLSYYTGAGQPFPHTGLLRSGDAPEFLFAFNAVDGVPCAGTNACEYRAGAAAATTGVAGGVKPSGDTAFTVVPVTVAANNNTYISVP